MGTFSNPLMSMPGRKRTLLRGRCVLVGALAFSSQVGADERVPSAETGHRHFAVAGKVISETQPSDPEPALVTRPYRPEGLHSRMERIAASQARRHELMALGRRAANRKSIDSVPDLTVEERMFVRYRHRILNPHD